MNKQLISNRRSGFTLIELLVVVAIIAVLVSMVIPGVKRVQAQARATVCMSNLRQLGIGLQSYALNNDGKIATNARLEDYDLYRWYRFLNGTLPTGMRRTVYVPGVVDGSADSVYRCPESYRKNELMNLGTTMASGTYGINSGDWAPEFQVTSFKVTIGTTTYNDEISVINMAAIRRPGNYGLLFDTSALKVSTATMNSFPGIGSPTWNADRFGVPGGSWPRDSHGIWQAHNKRANGLYADWSVQASGETEFRNASNRLKNSQKTMIRVWKKQDGTEVDMTGIW